MNMYDNVLVSMKLLYLLLMPSLLSADTIDTLPRPNKWIVDCRNAIDPTRIWGRTERNLLLLRNIVITDLIDDHFSNRNEDRTLVRYCSVV